VLKRGLQYHPKELELQQAFAQILAEMSKIKAVEKLNKCWQRDDQELKQVHLFSQQFLSIATNHGNAAQAQAWENRLLKDFINPLWPDLMLEPLEGRRLRVGYLSADFCNHPVGRFLLPVLTNHDQSMIESWALNCSSHDDWISAHIKNRVNHWLDLRFHTTAQAARLIADLRLDVLVELGGFTGESRIDVLCYRPAPVQLSYLGYPAPTYLKCIDGWIGDQILFEELNEVDRNAHSLQYINGGYMVFDSGGDLPIPERESGIPLRFGSFNHARKLSDETIRLYCGVLEANPGSELALKSISFLEEAEKQRIRDRFNNAGLEANRLILLDWVEGGLNHLKRYGAIDIALDPIPYGGATTTAEALWMGVPVVAMAGIGMVGRLAASLLVFGNQKQWLARSEDEYIKIASELASKGPRYQERRLKLREELLESPLADGKRLSRELEAIYLRMREAIKND
jgi:predicted O-linked N-acetylglucosamine transferase (SPINDLY family)